MNIDEPVYISPDELVDDWVRRRGTDRPRTENLQRAALLWVFQDERMFGWETACARLQAIPQESVRSKRVASDVFSPKNVRVKGKVIPSDDLQLLINQLMTMGTWGAYAQYFLLAGVASGARPIEWLNAKWIDESRTTLCIGTAKVKNKNAWHKILPTNNLDIPHPTEKPNLNAPISRNVFIEPQYRQFVRLHMDSVELLFQSVRTDPKNDHLSDEDLYKAEYYDKARHCIWRACRKAFADGTEKLYSLADTRHTFAANRKAKNGMLSTSLELGHSGITSTKDEYAPASKAWNKYKSKPVESLGSAPVHHQMPSPTTEND